MYWGSGAPDGLEALMAEASPAFVAADTAADDICLIGFTSGTTGEPKGTMHAHRDMLAICDAYSRNVLRPRGVRPLHRLAAARLHLRPRRPRAVPARMSAPRPCSWRRPRRTIFSPPSPATGPRSASRPRPPTGPCCRSSREHDLSSLRKCVSAGEALPKATFEAWEAATGFKLMDGIGATEMLHIFIAAREDEIRPGATGRPVPGYEAKVIDAEGHECPPGTIGRLAVRGPTGCRYLADDRQRAYVERGWNVTGDTYIRDEDGYFWYQARSDDMIVSAGYNIAGPEVEAALLTHPAVAECGVVGAPDPERGMVVKAYVVLRPEAAGLARDRPRPAGARQGRGRALQVPARRRVRLRAAQDPDRQAAALRAAPACAGGCGPGGQAAAE